MTATRELGYDFNNGAIGSLAGQQQRRCSTAFHASVKADGNDLVKHTQKCAKRCGKTKEWRRCCSGLRTMRY